MEVPIRQQPARQHQMKRRRQIGSKPTTVTHDGKAKQETHEHEHEVHAAEGEKENAATVTRDDFALSKSPGDVREPGDDQKLRKNESRIR